MNRRQVLAFAGFGVGVPGGYLAWNWDDSSSPRLPDGVAVETLYLTRNAFDDRTLESGPREETRTVVADPETAAAELVDEEFVTSFVEDTDFDQSYLVVVQTGMQSEPDLALSDVERTDDGVHLDLVVDHPRGRGVDDDLATHSLLVRITDEKADVPESVTVDIDGYV